MNVFSDKEKEIIRQNLINNAKKSFSGRGIKKTSIEELTRSVGIAKGSFYIFFKSKEALFFQILINEITTALPSNDIAFMNSRQSSIQSAREFLHKAISSMQTNPILKLMLIPEEYQQVYRRLSLDNDETAAFDIVIPLLSVIKQWKEAGWIIDADPILIANAIKSLFLLTTHQEEIGDTVYPDLMNFMIDMVVDKIFRVEK